MKKNKALTAALSVFALTMMSMCAIGGTFAKYVTSDNDTDSARVAKWGVTVDVAVPTDGTQLSTSDQNDNGDTPAFVAVQSLTSVNVVAPGTSGTILTVNVTGAPEVAVELNQEATVSFTGNWVIDHDNNNTTPDAFYCPIIFKVNGTRVGEDAASSSDLADEIVAALTRDHVPFLPNDPLLAYSQTLTWEWPFDGDDVADTALGNRAATQDLGFEVSVTTTVTQED